MKTKTDDEIISSHDSRARLRARAELEIVTQILKDAKAGGYQIVIDELEEDEYTQDIQNIKTNLFNLDEATIWLDDKQGRVRGVMLVFGNDGWDVIHDYNTSLEKDILKNALALAQKLGG